MSLESLKILKNLDKCFLHYILCIIVIVNNVIRQSEELAIVATYELLKCGPVSSLAG